MSRASLNRICKDENDPMLRETVRCKHGDLLTMQTSWSNDNPGRRFWSCPRYREKSCKFFGWRDRDEIDVRSKFVISRLANRVKDLEKSLAYFQSMEKEMKWVENECHDEVMTEGSSCQDQVISEEKDDHDLLIKEEINDVVIKEEKD
ncbi:uncharacterized protein LOC132038316 [Lycium ferocissimum]|uniref:uncharacterized protein LOC132038316 n=1 Tax=Lycium ferocissimum TaxID=112874 RepID=UPI0028165DD4|nr:uncharacterized protein LOC132038316 [Lycium ferocissimum]